MSIMTQQLLKLPWCLTCCCCIVKVTIHCTKLLQSVSCKCSTVSSCSPLYSACSFLVLIIDVVIIMCYAIMCGWLFSGPN